MLSALRRLALPALLLLVPMERARAQTIEDEGFWVMAFGSGSLEGLDESLKDFRWWLDVQPRYGDELDSIKQFLARPGIGYAFADNATAWLGYAYVQTDLASGGHSNEDRIWQQLTWSPGIESFNLASRTRLEQRFLDTGSDVGWRARQFFKATYPLQATRSLNLAAYDEVFFDLNDTNWGQEAGFSQNRAFLGLGWRSKPESPLTVEVGYLNQFVRRSTADRVNHILSINFLVSL